MRAHQLQGPGRLHPVEVPTPSAAGLAEGEVLVEVLAASLCGSDVPHFLRGGPPGSPAVVSPHLVGAKAPVGYPLHELVGEVVVSRSEGLVPGDRVVGWASRENGLAERVVTDGEGLAPCNPAWPSWHTVVAQPLACVLYAVGRLPSVRNADVAVIGLGPIGLLFSHVLRTAGARTVTGVDPVDRSQVGARFGLTRQIKTTSEIWARNLPEAGRPRVLIEAVGHQVDTLRDAVSAAAWGGTVYAFGIPELADYPIDVTALVRKNLTLMGGVTTARRHFLLGALNYLDEHPQLPAALTTHVLPLGDVQEAFELSSRPVSGQLKIVLTDHTRKDAQT